MITENGQFIVCSSAVMATTAEFTRLLLAPPKPPNHHHENFLFMLQMTRKTYLRDFYFCWCSLRTFAGTCCACLSNMLCATPRTRPLERRRLPRMPPSGGTTRGSGPREAPGRRTKCGPVTTACVCHRVMSAVAAVAYVYGESGPSRTFDTSCWPRVIRISARL